MTTEKASQQVKRWQEQNQTVVLVTGVFDILHIEHIHFLKNAKAAGDKLIVGIETDQRVSRIKGAHRPIHPQESRLVQLNALKPVDLAFLLPEKFDTQKDWETFTRELKPDIYAVSSHTSWLENKRQIAQKFGVDFQIVHQHNPDYSSTKIAKQLAKEI